MFQIARDILSVFALIDDFKDARVVTNPVTSLAWPCDVRPLTHEQGRSLPP